MKILMSSLHADSLVLSVSAVRTKLLTVQDVVDRTFQNCLVQSRNAVRSTENSLELSSILFTPPTSQDKAVFRPDSDQCKLCNVSVWSRSEVMSINVNFPTSPAMLKMTISKWFQSGEICHLPVAHSIGSNQTEKDKINFDKQILWEYKSYCTKAAHGPSTAGQGQARPSWTRSGRARPIHSSIIRFIILLFLLRLLHVKLLKTISK